MPRERSGSRGHEKEKRRKRSRSHERRRSPDTRGRSGERDKRRERSRGAEEEDSKRRRERDTRHHRDDRESSRRKESERRGEGGERKSSREREGHRRDASDGGEPSRRPEPPTRRQEPPSPKFKQEARYEWGKPDEEEGKKEKPKVIDQANFGLSGALATDENTGNMYKGVLMKWKEPDDAAKPVRGWRLYTFKGETLLDTKHLHRQSAYLIGRLKGVVNLEDDDSSVSKQHAVLQFRRKMIPGPDGSLRPVVKLYIMDLESVNGTLLNNEKIPPARYVELKEKDMIKFGYSRKEYVLLHESTA